MPLIFVPLETTPLKVERGPGGELVLTLGPVAFKMQLVFDPLGAQNVKRTVDQAVSGVILVPPEHPSI
jgi:hypothetical protein